MLNAVNNINKKQARETSYCVGEIGEISKVPLYLACTTKVLGKSDASHVSPCNPVKTFEDLKIKFKFRCNLIIGTLIKRRNFGG